jgi:hypothetical protein
MNRRYVLAVFPFLLLAGCETASPADTVRDEQAAIEMARKVCNWEKVGDGQSWHAKLRHGIWYVWFNAGYQRDENDAINSLEIRASDGLTRGCPVVT